MSIEIIKAKHTPLAAILIALAYFTVRNYWVAITEYIVSIASIISYAGVLIVFGLIGIALQYAENKYIWGRFLSLNDNLSFLGLSIGAAIGFISLGLW